MLQTLMQSPVSPAGLWIVIVSAFLLFAHAASAQTTKLQKEAFTPAGWPDPPAHVSWVTRAQGFVFCTGMLGLDVSTFELVNDTFEQEAKQLLENLRAMLESAGASLDDLVQVTVYLTDIDLYPEFNRIYVDFLGEGVKPARSAVVVSEIPMGARVEVDCIAVAP